MARIASLVAAVVLALAGCAGRAAAPSDTATAGASTPVSVDRGAAPAASPREDGRPRGRQAGIRVLQLGGQRTYWVERCPTDSPSSLREPCSLTRADVPAD